MFGKNDNDTLGTKLLRYRLEREWTLEQMAAATGMSVSAISKIERNRVQPHALTVHKLRKRLPGLIGEAA